MLETTAGGATLAEIATRPADAAGLARPDVPAHAASIADVLGAPATDGTEPVGTGTGRAARRLFIVAAVAGGILAGLPWLRARLEVGHARIPFADVPAHVVSRGSFVISVTEDGSLVSDENVDIVCGVAGGATIVWMVDDGARVTEGMEIVRLDSSVLAESVTAQRIAFEKARAAKIQAEKDYAAAVIAVEEYTEGTFKKDLRKAESDVTAAQERLQATRNTLAHGERMFRKGYITPQQLDAQKAAVARAELDLGTANIALDVLNRFARPKMVTELQSTRDAAEARRDSEQAALDLEQVKLERLTSQLERCTIIAPKDGLAIYANDRNRDRESEIRTGAKVSEGKTILRLPNLSKMRVDVEVHEAKVDKIRVGMRAEVRVQGREFPGRVTAVANRPESSWYSTIKKYLVQVRIDGNTEELRPGFTAEAEIVVADLEDVVAVPVAAVIERDGRFVCAVRHGDTVERREVSLGQSNDRFVEILSGLDEGETVLLDPRTALGEGTSASQPASPGGVVEGRD